MLAQSRATPKLKLTLALEGARRHWWRRTLVDAMLGALLVASVGVAVAWVRGWYSGAVQGLLTSGPDLTWVAAAAGGGLVLWLVLSALRAPTLLDMARRVDRLFGQSERFTTSLEVLAAGGPANAVSAALVSDVGERASRLKLWSAGWARSSGRGLSVSALVGVLVAGLLLSLPMPSRTIFRTDPAGAGARVLNLPAKAEVDTLMGVAELLDVVAEQEENDYLRAVAASLSDLADKLDSRVVTAEEAGRSVQELAEHLRLASQEVGGDFARAVEEAFLSPALQASPNTEGSLANETFDVASASDDAGREKPGQVNRAEVGDDAALTYGSLSSLVEQFDRDPQSMGIRGSDTQDGSALVDCFSEGVFCDNPIPSTPLLTDAPDSPLQNIGGGLPIGAAQRSNDAPGDAAGKGTTELGNGSDAFLDLATQTGGLAALPINERDDGEFVATELVPEEEPLVPSSSAYSITPPAFARGDEAASLYIGIGAGHAEVVRRYFTPGSESSNNHD